MPVEAPQVPTREGALAKEPLLDAATAQNFLITDRVKLLETVCDTGARPFLEALAATGRPDQIEAFVNMQMEIKDALGNARHTHSPRGGNAEGATKVEVRYGLPNGPVLSATLEKYYDEHDPVNGRGWVIEQRWNASALNWLGLVEAAAVYDSIQCMRGGSRENFQTYTGDFVDYGATHRNLGYVARAVRRADAGKPEPGDELILEVVARLGSDPHHIAQCYTHYARSARRTANYLSDLKASVQKPRPNMYTSGV